MRMLKGSHLGLKTNLPALIISSNEMAADLPATIVMQRLCGKRSFGWERGKNAMKVMSVSSRQSLGERKI